MTTITITRSEQGKIVGFGEKAQRAWLRLVATIHALAIGEVMKISYKFPRNGPFHRLHFVMLGKVFENQEQFGDVEELRMWLQVGAGHCKFVPGPHGRMCAIPLSISYDSIDDHEMREHHEKVKDFLRSERAQAFLWGHLSVNEQMNKVDSILRGFERHDTLPTDRDPAPLLLRD